MLSRIFSISLVGLTGYIVEIEVDIHKGLPAFNMVGLPDTAVKESKERVRAAIKNSGFEFPVEKLTVNFAPADLKKEGTHLDLAIAVAVLKCIEGDIKFNIKDSIFIGELSLNGDIRGVSGVLPMIIEAKRNGFKSAFIPFFNINEVSFIQGIDLYPITSLIELIAFLKEECIIQKITSRNTNNFFTPTFDIDFNEVKGQKISKRAVEIAASASHNLLMLCCFYRAIRKPYIRLFC